MKKKIIGLILIIIGLVLFFDEIWMVGVPIGSSGWLIGDWSFIHVEPFHHYMLGIGMVIVGGVMLK